MLARDYTRERRDHAAARRQAFVAPPSGRNQVWQLDFSEYETTQGGTWQISGCADYWAKAELGWHVSMTQNHRDAITAVNLAIAEAEALMGHTLAWELTNPLTRGDPPHRLGHRQRPGVQSEGVRSVHRRQTGTHPHPHETQITRTKRCPGTGIRSLKYEHLYRIDIPTDRPSPPKSRPTDRPSTASDHTKPSACKRPMDRYLKASTEAPTPTQNEPELLPHS